MLVLTPDQAELSRPEIDCDPGVITNSESPSHPAGRTQREAAGDGNLLKD